MLEFSAMALLGSTSKHAEFGISQSPTYKFVEMQDDMESSEAPCSKQTNAPPAPFLIAI